MTKFMKSHSRMNCLLLRELPLKAILRLWDTYLSEETGGFENFHVYVCAVLLKTFKEKLMIMVNMCYKLDHNCFSFFLYNFFTFIVIHQNHLRIAPHLINVIFHYIIGFSRDSYISSRHAYIWVG